MTLYKCLKLITCIFVLFFAGQTYAQEPPADNNSGEAQAADCTQRCIELCRAPIDGESIKSLSLWVCQQCLTLCQQQGEPPEEKTLKGCHPKPYIML